VDRELVLAVLLLVFGGLLLFATAQWAPAPLSHPSARTLEGRLWQRVWLPLSAPALALSMLLGWALNEPERAEAVPFILMLAAGPVAIIWVRALVRASRAVVLRAPGTPIMTVGVLRPRIVLDPSFANILDAEALNAACEHEKAHARHRDPLRIWLAQLGTDLQWPSRTARTRFEDWLHALEMARDEEARIAGADGPDLASAIITAARLGASGRHGPLAAVTGNTPGIQERIERLLAPVPSIGPAVACRVRAAFVVALGSAALFGTIFGEPLVRALLTGQL
jgi:hypothetical protein